ncbi:hypothetical protein N3553_25555, partial [Pantoea dispersa]|uniref:hypothetical protein n=1 Tax=Pantoea dispersa TaxID=59814 RepID=UPI0021B04195
MALKASKERAASVIDFLRYRFFMMCVNLPAQSGVASHKSELKQSMYQCGDKRVLKTQESKYNSQSVHYS